MGSSSKNSTTTSSQIQSKGYGGDLQQKMDERKRKRMTSNRESAKRSRARKQRHVDDLTAQVAQMKRENTQMSHNINLTTQQCLKVEAENSVLNAQMCELNQRLESLNEMINYMYTLNRVSIFEEDCLGLFGNCMGDFGIMNDGYNGNIIINNNPWNLVYLNQPIMASIDHYLPDY